MQDKINRSNFEDLLSLSSTQEGMLFHYLREPDSQQYLEQLSITLIGEINIDRIKDTWQLLSEHNEMLRTVFRWKGLEKPIQIVLKEHKIPFNILDISHDCIKSYKKHLNEIKEADLQRKIDISAEPFRITLVILPENQVEMIVTNHHILYDGWSTGILIKEFFQVYEGLSKDLQRMKFQKSKYKDFIKWCNKRETVQQKQYWEKFLEDFDNPTSLPMIDSLSQLQRKATGKNEAVKQVLQLPVSLVKDMKRFCEEHSITMATLLYTGWGILLGKYSSSRDVIFGTTVSGRPPDIQGIEEMVGLFINTPPLRVTMGKDQKVKDLLKEIHYQLNERTAYENTPLVEIQQYTKLFDQSLFDNIVVIENYPIEQLIRENEGSIKVQGLSMVELTNYNLTLGISMFDGIELTLVSHGNFEESNRLLEHYINIISGMVGNPHQTIEEIEILSKNEKKLILEDFNSQKVDYPREKTIVQLFEEGVAKAPDKVAVFFEGKELTYGELNEKANHLANLLMEKGVTTNTIVGIMVERSQEMIVGMLAILKAGGAYLPIDPDYPEVRIKYMLEDSETKLLLTQSWLWNKEDFKNSFNNFEGDIMELDKEELFLSKVKDVEVTAKSTPDDLAYVIYTSGSTGNPKGVMVNHRSVINLCHWFNEKYNIAENPNILQMTNLSFDVSVEQIFGGLLNGGRVLIPTKEVILNREKFCDFVRENGIQIAQFVPATLEMLLGEGEKLESLKIVTVGGDQLREELKNRILSKGYRLFNHYGPTEATVDALVEECSLDRKVTIGRPINNVNVFVLQGQRLLPIGAVGELCISGDGLAMGYLNRPELTAEKFVDHPFVFGEKMYRTGDLARWLPDGRIEFLGRMDNQVKVRGYRIELEEIEEHLLKHQNIREAIVVRKEDATGGQYLCGYIVGEENINIVNLKRALAMALPSFMIPDHIIQLEKIPLTPNGKIDRKALPVPDGSISLGMEYEAPRNRVEEVLVAIWQEILGVEGFGINQNFFHLGGHSLRATTLVAKIHKSFEVEVPLKEIFSKPTIKELAVLIEASKESIYSEIKPVEEKEYYEASAAQKRLYTLQQFEPDGLGYNMCGAVMLEGNVDKKRIEEAFINLVKRHETLRTSFRMEEGELVQYIHKEVGFQIENMEAGQTELLEITKKFLRPFDLRKAPLLRVGLVKVDLRYLLIFDMHHIISDGVSIGILVKEFAELYREGDLKPLRIQYKDFSEGQKQLIASGKLEEQKKYWLQQMEGEIPVLNLMGDYPRPAIQSFDGDRIDYKLNKTLTHNLRKVTRESGATMYMILLSALNILFSKYSGQEDIIIGSTIAGRSHGDLNNIIGMFVNTLVMRNAPTGNKTFKEFLTDVKKKALEAYENQDYQFEDLIENLNLRRDMSRNPLFDVMFTMQNVDIEDLTLEGLSIKPFGLINHIAKFDITFFAMENEDWIDIGIEYATKIFKKETIHRLYKHLEYLLNQIVENQDILLSQIQLITEEEKQHLMLEFNDTKTLYPTISTIHQLFERQVVKNPDAVAVIYEGNQLTYGGLNGRANQLARELRKKGVNSDCIVAVMMERSLELVVGVMAILKAGGAYLPIDPKYPEDPKSYMLEESESNLLLTQSKFQEGINFTGEVILLDDEEIYVGENSNLPNINNPNDLAYVLFTSGSTGRPKGVMIQHNTSLNTLFNLQKQFPILDGDSYLLKTNYCFDVSVIELFAWFVEEAGKLVILPPSEEMEPRKIMKVIKREAVTHVNFVPSMMQIFMDYIKEDNIEELDSLKYVILGGEAVTKDLARRFYEKMNDREISLENIYGPTENSIYCSRYAIPRDEDHCSVPIGTPVPNVSIYILNSSFQQQPIGVPGELCIGGGGLGRGYLNRQDLTAEKFINHPFVEGEKMYRTGDLARWLEDGNIEYLGRIDHQVKIRGYRIELGEIENIFLKHENIQEAVVVAKEGKDGSKYLCGYFTGNEPINIGEVKAYLVSELPEYMVPSYLVQLDCLPLNSNGKVDRRSLLEIADGDFREDDYEYEAPRDDLEEKLVGIWQEVLGVNNIGITQNFFDLGGHSLKATRMIAMIHNRLNIEVPLTELFKNPNIKALGDNIKKKEKKDHQRIDLLPEADYYPLSSAQRRIYLQCQTVEKSTAYNMSFGIILEGDLDIKKVEESINGLVERHEALRSSFRMVKGIPMQQIEKNIRINMDYYEAKEEELEGILQEFIKPFDLAEFPLLRVKLIKLTTLKFEAPKHLLLFDHHHIISDGVSAAILTRDFVNLYEGRSLKPLRIQYKEYAAWHNSLLESERMKELEDYWLRKLEDFAETNLPMTGKPSSEDKGKIRTIELDADLTKRINQFCKQHQVTKAVLILAVFKLLLSESINQDRVIVGIPVAGRRHIQLEDVVGVFLNVLILPTYITYEGKFLDFLKELGNHFMEIQEYQDYPYELLHKQASKKLKGEYSSLFSILYNYMPHQEANDLGISGLKLKPYQLQEAEAKYSLTLYVKENKETITLEAVYQPNVEEYIIENILNSMPIFIEEILTKEEIKIEDLLSPEPPQMMIEDGYDGMFDELEDFF